MDDWFQLNSANSSNQMNLIQNRKNANVPGNKQFIRGLSKKSGNIQIYLSYFYLLHWGFCCINNTLMYVWLTDLSFIIAESISWARIPCGETAALSLSKPLFVCLFVCLFFCYFSLYFYYFRQFIKILTDHVRLPRILKSNKTWKRLFLLTVCLWDCWASCWAVKDTICGNCELHFFRIHLNTLSPEIHAFPE